MSAYERDIVNPPSRVEYVLPSPTNWAEVGKVVSAIQRDGNADNQSLLSDDYVTVEARDDAIVFWFEVSDD